MILIQEIEGTEMAGKRGLRIVFEGCDRSGKSTQARKLIEALKSRGQDAKFMRFPGTETFHIFAHQSRMFHLTLFEFFNLFQYCCRVTTELI